MYFLSLLWTDKIEMVKNVAIRPERNNPPTCSKLTNGDKPSRSIMGHLHFGDPLQFGCIGQPSLVCALRENCVISAELLFKVFWNFS